MTFLISKSDQHVLYIDLRPGWAVKIGNAPVWITGASGRGISEYNLDHGQVEWVQFVTPTKRRWALNYYITQCTGSSISWRSDAVEKTSTQRAQENGKEMRLWLIEWGSICCSSVQSPTPSHTQPFQIKWEVYFSRELCCSSLLCRWVLHAYVYI